MNRKAITGILAKRRKGMVYTIFAVIMIVSIMATLSYRMTARNMNIESASSRITVDNMYYFVDGASEDIQRSTYISGKRAVISLLDRIITNGTYSQDAKGQIETLIRNGTYNGSALPLMVNSTLDSWNSTLISIGNSKNLNVNISFPGLNISSHAYNDIKLNVTASIIVSSSDGKIRLNKTENPMSFIEFTNLEDPLHTIGSYGYLRKLIVFCNMSKYPYHAKNIVNGTSYNGTWSSGRAYISNGSDIASIPNRAETVIVLKDIPGSLPPQITEFAAVVSENASDENVSVTRVYGALNATSVLSNNSLIVISQKEVWINNILDELSEGCYFEDAYGPGFLDRLEGNFNTTSKYNSTQSVGIGSFVNVANLPAELQEARSDVDFIYFNYGNNPALYKVKGVTEKKSGLSNKEWFRLDSNHVSLWNMSSLSY